MDAGSMDADFSDAGARPRRDGGDAGLPPELASLRAGEWYEVPSSRLIDVMPSIDMYPSFSGRSSSIIGAWSGGVFDSSRDQLVIWGGGHNDYSGNEVYGFDARSLVWEQLTDPNPDPNRCGELNSDGTPVARHTYNGLAYITSIDSMFGLGGALDCGPGGCGANVLSLLDLGSGRWSQPGPSGDNPSTGCEDTTAYDEATDRVYYHSNWDLSVYDVAANTWTGLSDATHSYAQTSAIDPVRRLLVQVGNGSVNSYSLDGASVTGGELATTGDNAIVAEGDPGLAYDPILGEVVAWHGGTDVYALNPESGVWTRYPPAATNTVTPPEVTSAGGVYGRFHHIASLNLYIMVQSAEENVFFYRLTDG